MDEPPASPAQDASAAPSTRTGWVKGPLGMSVRDGTGGLKATLCAVGPTLPLNIWPDVASLTAWLPDLFTAEAEASPKKARARPVLAEHAALRCGGKESRECWSRCAGPTVLSSKSALRMSVFGSIRLAAPPEWGSCGKPQVKAR